MLTTAPDAVVGNAHPTIERYINYQLSTINYQLSTTIPSIYFEAQSVQPYKGNLGDIQPINPVFPSSR